MVPVASALQWLEEGAVSIYKQPGLILAMVYIGLLFLWLAHWQLKCIIWLLVYVGLVDEQSATTMVSQVGILLGLSTLFFVWVDLHVMHYAAVKISNVIICAENMLVDKYGPAQFSLSDSRNYPDWFSIPGDAHPSTSSTRATANDDTDTALTVATPNAVRSNTNNTKRRFACTPPS